MRSATQTFLLHNSFFISAAFLFIFSAITAQAQNAASSPNPAPTPPVGEAVQDDKPVIIQTDVVSLTISVTDNYGRFVSGLKKDAFTVFDEGKQQEIEYFTDTDAPVSIGLVFDVSGSMDGEKISKAREALGKFIDTSHPRDEFFLIGFNTRAQLLVDRTRDGDAVRDKLTFVKPTGDTALYDACYLGVEKVTHGTLPKKAMIIISDGQDNSSRYTFSDVRKLLKESDVVVYSVGILGGGDFSSSLGAQGQAYLSEISGVTGGRAFFPTTEAEFDEIFERIAIELRHQYFIGYRPTNLNFDGKWRELKVKVKPPRGLPRLVVRTREGYYAAPNAKFSPRQ